MIMKIRFILSLLMLSSSIMASVDCNKLSLANVSSGYFTLVSYKGTKISIARGSIDQQKDIDCIVYALENLEENCPAALDKDMFHKLDDILAFIPNKAYARKPNANTDYKKIIEVMGPEQISAECSLKGDDLDSYLIAYALTMAGNSLMRAVEANNELPPCRSIAFSVNQFAQICRLDHSRIWCAILAVINEFFIDKYPGKLDEIRLVLNKDSYERLLLSLRSAAC